jgi:hypothetical protein
MIHNEEKHSIMEDAMLTAFARRNRRAIISLLAAAGVMALLALFSTTAFADAPTPLQEDPGTCALCHQAEVQDWQASPHSGAMSSMDPAALAECKENQGADCTCLSCHTSSFDPTVQTVPHEGVTCEACHGKFVEGHPENGEMRLSVDSSVCSDCHTETHKSWQNTAHAQAGVQCIGCHRSHTQNLRLDDEHLCISCHRDRLEDRGHAVHLTTAVNCIDCHTSPATMITTDGQLVSSHQFAVATDSCASCHGQTFHEDLAMAGQAALPGATAEVVAGQEAAADETPAEIVAEQADRRWLQGATALSFGLGVGFGAMVGIVFMLVIALVVQRPWRRKL